LRSAVVTALPGLRERGRIAPGQRVLVIGASGAVGTFAVQLARWFDTEVTGVCSSRNADMVRSLGAAARTLVLSSGMGRFGGLDRIVTAADDVAVRRSASDHVVADESREDLVLLAEPLEAGDMTPVIETSYELSAVPDAIRHVEAGHAGEGRRHRMSASFPRTNHGQEV
jgi:NADPH:quinone reductase-like Zn-dependent oxidoreductase